MKARAQRELELLLPRNNSLFDSCAARKRYLHELQGRQTSSIEELKEIEKKSKSPVEANLALGFAAGLVVPLPLNAHQGL